MCRLVFMVLYWAASLLFILVLLIWIASGMWYAPQWRSAGGWTVGGWYLYKQPNGMRQRAFQLFIRDGDLDYEQTWPTDESVKVRRIYWKWKNFRVESTRFSSRGHVPRRVLRVQSPAWIPVALVGTIPITAALRIRWKRHRIRRLGRCDRCRYSLVGLPDPDYGDVATRVSIQAQHDMRRCGRGLLRSAATGTLFGLALIVGLSVIAYYVPRCRVLDSRLVEFVVYPLLPVTGTSWIGLWLSTLAYYAGLFLLCRFLFGLRLPPTVRRHVPGGIQKGSRTARCPECGWFV